MMDDTDSKWDPDKPGPPPIPTPDQPGDTQPAPAHPGELPPPAPAPAEHPDFGSVLPPAASSQEPRVEVGASRLRRKASAGGTTVSGGLPMPWLIGGGALVLIVIVAIAMSGGDDDKQAAVAEADAGADVGDPDPEDDDRPRPPPGPSQELRDAVWGLSQAFEAQKVISSVKLAPAQPSIVLISSVYCSDSVLASVLDDHLNKLRTLGVTLVKCFARDGAVVFERQL